MYEFQYIYKKTIHTNFVSHTDNHDYIYIHTHTYIHAHTHAPPHTHSCIHTYVAGEQADVHIYTLPMKPYMREKNFFYHNLTSTHTHIHTYMWQANQRMSIYIHCPYNKCGVAFRRLASTYVCLFQLMCVVAHVHAYVHA
jgi:hypothetical protein